VHPPFVTTSLSSRTLYQLEHSPVTDPIQGRLNGKVCPKSGFMLALLLV
jgi:hypothetical protein